MKHILVIGGSYFVGRVLCTLASREPDEYKITIVNRGRYKVNKPNVEELVCDRHNTVQMRTLLSGRSFDAVVDLCGYYPGEAAPLIEFLSKNVPHYIFVSTASVYAYHPESRDESTEKIAEAGDLPGGDYALQKALLEDEVIDACQKHGMAWTIFRPAFIYGPYNYAQRESFYVRAAVNKGLIPVPYDSHSRFSFVYAIDVAQALLRSAVDKRVFNDVFNLSGPEELTYHDYMAAFEKAYGEPVDVRLVSISEVLQQNIPLPFPMETNEVYDGRKFAKAMDFAYTPFEEGFGVAVRVFKDVFESQKR